MKHVTLLLLAGFSSLAFSLDIKNGDLIDEKDLIKDIKKDIIGEDDNISIETDRYEIVFVDGKETKFKTKTLKPVIIFEDNIKITNITEKEIKSVVYDFHLDSKSTLFSDMDDPTDNIETYYSIDKGKNYLKFPIILDEEEVPLSSYTDIKMVIGELDENESTIVKVRYEYNHFK